MENNKNFFEQVANNKSYIEIYKELVMDVIPATEIKTEENNEEKEYDDVYIPEPFRRK